MWWHVGVYLLWSSKWEDEGGGGEGGREGGGSILPCFDYLYPTSEECKWGLRNANGGRGMRR